MFLLFFFQFQAMVMKSLVYRHPPASISRRPHPNFIILENFIILFFYLFGPDQQRTSPCTTQERRTAGLIVGESSKQHVRHFPKSRTISRILYQTKSEKCDWPLQGLQPVQVSFDWMFYRAVVCTDLLCYERFSDFIFNTIFDKWLGK